MIGSSVPLPSLLAGIALLSLILLVAALFDGTARQLRRRILHGGEGKARRRKGATATEIEAVRIALRRSRGGFRQRLASMVPRIGPLGLLVEASGLADKTPVLVAWGWAGAAGWVFVAFNWTGLDKIGIAILAGPIGVWTVLIVLVAARRRRRTRFLQSLPDAVDLVVRSVKSGLPVTEAIQSIAADMNGPVAEEFAAVSHQVKLGVSLHDALERMAGRMQIRELFFLVVTLSIQRETGGNLSEALSGLSKLLRQRQQMKLKIKALSSEARSSAMIIGVLPFAVGGVLMILNPTYLAPLWEQESGRMMLAGAAVSMSFGIFIMVRMVRFKQ